MRIASKKGLAFAWLLGYYHYLNYYVLNHYKKKVQFMLDTLTTNAGQIITGGVIASGVTAVQPLPLPVTHDIVGQLISIAAPFVMSLISHVVLNLLKKKRNANQTTTSAK